MIIMRTGKGGDMQTYYVNIEEVLEDLRDKWRESSYFRYNPTAFTRKKANTENINMCCPFHHETKPSFGVSTTYPYLFNCFSCGVKGNLINLVSHVYEISYLKAYSKILRDYSATVVPSFNQEIEEDWDGVTEEEIYNYRKKRHSYIENRGLSDYTLQKYEVGYDEKDYSITFPVRDLEGNPVFTLKRNVSSKFYHIPKNAPKHKVLYGLNYLYGKVDEVFIVEGAIDVLSCYEAKLPAVAVLGRTLSKHQLKLLQKAGINKVILFLDNDKWGVKGNLDAYSLISKTGIKVEVVKYPIQWGIDTVDDVKFKDPNDLLLGNKLDCIEIVTYLEYYFNLLQSKFSKGVFFNGS